MNHVDRAKALRQARLDLGYTQPQMAEAMGISLRTVTRLELSCPHMPYLAALYVKAQAQKETS